MRPVLVLRPEPGATRTADSARAMGLDAVVVPLFAVAPLEWSARSAHNFDAVIFTSANALAHGGPAIFGYTALPTYAVGTATAEAARRAGFVDVREGGSDAAALVERLAADGRARVLHLGGLDRRDAEAAGVTIERVALYESRALPKPEALATALVRAPVALAHSPRAAARLAELAAPEQRARVILAAISAAAASAAGAGWQSVAIADRPDDAALLELAARLCDTCDQ